MYMTSEDVHNSPEMTTGNQGERRERRKEESDGNTGVGDRRGHGSQMPPCGDVKPRAGTRFQRWKATHSTNPDTRVEAAKVRERTLPLTLDLGLIITQAALRRDPATNHEGRVAARSELKA